MANAKIKYDDVQKMIEKRKGHTMSLNGVAAKLFGESGEVKIMVLLKSCYKFIYFVVSYLKNNNMYILPCSNITLMRVCELICCIYIYLLLLVTNLCLSFPSVHHSFVYLYLYFFHY